MQASPANIIDYFNGEKQNLIPLFQRPYRWSTDKWETLWEDVMIQYELGDSANHFMGAIVSVPAKSVPVGVSKYLIIDGQQRLTTIALLLCALRDCVDPRTADRIQEVYLTNRHREPEDTLKFVPTQADRDAFRLIALDRRIPENGSLVATAYRFFANKLKNAEDANDQPVLPAKILSCLERALQVVMINLTDNDDPYLIFESLNFKGEPLSQADLVRNYVLMRFRHSPTSGGEQERVYSRHWRPLENELGGSLTEFLRHYSMKEGEDIRQGGIYAAVKNRLRKLDTAGKVETEMEAMRVYGGFYARFLTPVLETNGAIRRRLEHIANLEVTTAFPLLLRLFGARHDRTLTDEDLENCLALVEAFAVRRSVCAVPTNALNKLFLQWARNFPLSGHLTWLHASMSDGKGNRRFPRDEEFAESFCKSPQYGRGATTFVLHKLEKSFEHKEAVDLSSATVEHVLPQTLTEEWIAALGETAKSTHARLLNTMGNLTLTGYNSELQNAPFREKKARLQTTHIELNRWILEQENWGAPQIEQRAQVLLPIAISLWNGPAITGPKTN
jgi:hypothetical protein